MTLLILLAAAALIFAGALGVGSHLVLFTFAGVLIAVACVARFMSKQPKEK